MGYQVVNGVVQYPPLSAENRARILNLVTLLDTGKGVTMADLRRVAGMPRLELYNALSVLSNEGALSRARRASQGGVEFEYFSLPGGE